MKNEEPKRQMDKELSRLSKGFNALNRGYKKGVLKTAQGLLRIQRLHKEILGEEAGNSAFSVVYKK